MDSFTCPMCQRSFKSKQGMTRHIEGEVCIKPNRTCHMCGKVFTDRRNCVNHMTNKVCQQKSKIKLTLKTDIRDENLRLSGQVEIHPQIVNNNSGNNQIVNNQTVNQTVNIIVPPAFLKMENYQHLVEQMPHLLHKALSLHPGNCISYLIKETNCNPNLPLYNSVRITNKRDPFAQVSNGTKYIYESKKKIIENKRHILQQYVDDNGDKYGEKILNRYQNYVDFLDDDKESLKELEVDIICMLLNVSDVIGSDEWSKKLLDDLNHLA